MSGADRFRVPGWLIPWAILGLLVLLCKSVLALVGFILMTVLPLLGTVMVLFARKKLTVRLRFPALGTSDADLEGWVEVNNPTAWPVGQVICRIQMENRLTGQRQTASVGVHPGTKQTAKTELCFASKYCGYVKLSTKRIVVTDLTGVIPIPLPIRAEAKLTALPELQEANLSLHYPSLTPDDGESWLEGRKGSDYTEILQLREYVPGDSVRQIHWKLSSKLDKTIVKDPSFPVSRSLLIFWDKTAAPAAADQMHAMAEALFAVCQSITAQGFAYTLAWNDGAAIQTEPIQTEEELLQTLPRLLKSGCRDLDHSALVDWNRSDRARYSKILYFAAGCPGEALLDEFADGSDLTALLCSQETAGSYRTVCYMPETCRQMLQNLELEA